MFRSCEFGSCEPYALCIAHREYDEYLADLDAFMPGWEAAESALDNLSPSDFPIDSHDFADN